MVAFYYLGATYKNELIEEEKKFFDPSIKKDYLWFLRFNRNIVKEGDYVYLIIYAFISLLIYQYTKTDILVYVYFQLLFFILYLVSYIDIKIKIIPDAAHVYLIILGLVLTGEVTNIGQSEIIYGIIGGYIMLFSAMWITSVILNKEAMGMGDVKLVSSLGAIIGIGNIPFMLLLSAIMALVFIPFYKDKERPFGQFISASAFVLIVNEYYQYIDIKGFLLG
jgi:prepilin signal peptidase PulO-like enzyme (type II secretory pathway)